VRESLVCATAGAACLAVASSRQLVTSFGGAVRTLGTANTYFDDGATLVGWLLALAALLLAVRAARGLHGSRATRTGLGVAAIGTLLMAGAAAVALWRDAVATSGTSSPGWLATATQGSSLSREVANLSRASTWLVAAGWLALGVAALLARPTRTAGDGWGKVLAVLGAGFALLAMGTGASTVLVSTTSPLTQGQALACFIPPVLGWLSVGLAIALASGPLRRRPASRAVTIAVPFGALGAVALAGWWGTILAFAELQLHGTTGSWFADLSRWGAAAEWAGWLLLGVAFGLAAARVRDASADRAVAQHFAP
jgi:hypothetical protein